MNCKKVISDRQYDIEPFCRCDLLRTNLYDKITAYCIYCNKYFTETEVRNNDINNLKDINSFCTASVIERSREIVRLKLNNHIISNNFE